MDKYHPGNLAVKDDRIYTYADYKTWPDNERWELIEGDAYDMAPAPGTSHQRLATRIIIDLGAFLKGKPCELFAAPFDVFFPEGDEDEDQVTTVVQPDISVICDDGKITEKGCMGAPDLIVEILSPSTAYKDETRKFKLYQREGVKEYWIVNPERPMIEVYTLNNGIYSKPKNYDQNDVLPSTVFKGFTLNLKEIFQS